MTKKILAILVAVFMLATGAAVALSGAATNNAAPAPAANGNSLPDCELGDGCFNCDPCLEFIFAYNEAVGAFFVAANFGNLSLFINAAAMVSFNVAAEELRDSDDVTFFELITVADELARQYMTPQAIAFGLEFLRMDVFIDLYYNNLPDALVRAADETLQAAVLLMQTGNFGEATTALVALNEVLVEFLADNGIVVSQWLRSTPAATPVCPVDPDATVCLCDDVTTTAPQDTTTVADTTVNDETTTAADTTVPEETTTVADTTVNGETTTAAETTTETPAEGGTNWGSIAGIIGIVVLVIVNLVAIFGFVRILFNA